MAETRSDERKSSAVDEGARTRGNSAVEPAEPAEPNARLFYTVLAGAVVVAGSLVVAWPNLLGNTRYLALVVLTPLLGGAVIALASSGMQRRLPGALVNGVRASLVLVVALDLAAFALPIVLPGAAGHDAAPVFVTPNAASTAPAATATAVSKLPTLTGQFDPHSGSHGDSVSGTALLGLTSDGSAVLRLQDLKATNGPDLYVYLSKAVSPMTNADVMNGIEVGRLKATSGDSNYTLPAGTQIGTFESVAVYCKSFSTLFGYANLASA